MKNRERCQTTYINFHLLVKTVVHNQAVCHTDTMRLHRVSRNVGIVSHVRVVEIRDSLLLRGTVHVDIIDRRKGRHGDKRIARQEGREYKEMVKKVKRCNYMVVDGRGREAKSIVLVAVSRGVEELEASEDRSRG